MIIIILYIIIIDTDFKIILNICDEDTQINRIHRAPSLDETSNQAPLQIEFSYMCEIKKIQTQRCAGWYCIFVNPEGHPRQDNNHTAWYVRLDSEVSHPPTQVEEDGHDDVFP